MKRGVDEHVQLGVAANISGGEAEKRVELGDRGRGRADAELDGRLTKHGKSQSRSVDLVWVETETECSGEGDSGVDTPAIEGERTILERKRDIDLAACLNREGNFYRVDTRVDMGAAYGEGCAIDDGTVESIEIGLQLAKIGAGGVLTTLFNGIDY